MIKRFLFWFLVFFAIFFFIQSFTGGKKTPQETPNDVYITLSKERYKIDEFVVVTVHNGREAAVEVPNDCPGEPLDVFFRDKAVWTPVETTSNKAVCEEGSIIIEPGGSYSFSYAPWNFELFKETGEYKIEVILPVKDAVEEGLTYTADAFFEIKGKGIFGTVWNEGIYRPIYNLLIFFTKIIPGHNFGMAIILLTLIIRLVLLVPNQKALRSQREMQKIQPELDAIKRKYEGNQEMIAKKTMEIWKQHKVNPMGSCLPMLIQLPILIALFYVARNGLDPYNTHVLYGSLKTFNLGLIDTNFLWLDLSQIDRYILPIVVGLLQFGQMKLVSAGIKKRKDDTKKEEKKGAADMMQNMNLVMTYFMPVMIALMTASFPSGVGLYWGFSTLFGIGQQVVVNKEKRKKKKEKSSDSSAKEDDIKVIDVTPEEPEKSK
jgi:YidC/Oxa1 family membrane protein insertase